MLDFSTECQKPRICNAVCAIRGSRREWPPTSAMRGPAPGALRPGSHPASLEKAGSRDGPASMWRYAPVLPPADESIVSLGEGWTPLIRSRRLGARLGAEALWVKDEGLNPTASFKARGLSCAISMCVELGIRKVAIPSAGNAASAMAAYAAAAGIEAHIFMPRDVPQANYLECMAYGAHVTLVDGLIGDCGAHGGRARTGRRLVRRRHAQGAVSHRRQEDHGLRSGRADWIGNCQTPSSIPPAAAWD